MGEAEARARGREFSLARAVSYRWLSRSLLYPSEDLLELCNSARTEELLGSWRYLGLVASEEVAQIVGWLEGCSSPESALEALQKEYTRLFVNAYPRVPAPPYSSVYLGGEKSVWGASTAEAARLYEAAGLRMASEFHDVLDHIAAELEFVSWLICEQQKGGSGGPLSDRDLASIEEKFLKRHLFKWAMPFFDRVIECSSAVFYTEVALLARRFIQWDEQRSRGR